MLQYLGGYTLQFRGFVDVKVRFERTQRNALKPVNRYFIINLPDNFRRQHIALCSISLPMIMVAQKAANI